MRFDKQIVAFANAKRERERERESNSQLESLHNSVIASEHNFTRHCERAKRAWQSQWNCQ